MDPNAALEALADALQAHSKSGSDDDKEEVIERRNILAGTYDPYEGR